MALNVKIVPHQPVTVLLGKSVHQKEKILFRGHVPVPPINHMDAKSKKEAANAVLEWLAESEKVSFAPWQRDYLRIYVRGRVLPRVATGQTKINVKEEN